MSGASRIDGNLFASTTRALRWSYGLATLRAFASFIIGVMLARILGPEPFGIIAVAGVVISLSTLVSDFGLGSALIQARTIEPAHVRFVFTWQMIIALILFLVVAFLSNVIASAFNLPEAQRVVVALASLFVINAIGQTSTSLLKRRMAFKQLQLTLAGSVLTAYGLLGVPAALLGLGVWSLVIAQLAQGLIANLIVYAIARHPLQPMFRLGTHTSRFLSFGSSVVVANVANWTIDNLPRIIVGRAFGATDLGLYNRTYTLLAAPMNIATGSLQSVLFPAYSKAQSRPAVMRRVYAGSMNALSLATLPAFVGVAVVSGRIVDVVLGSEWASAGPLMAPLALAMPINSLMALGGPLIWGIGKVGTESKFQLVTALALAVALAVTASFSLLAVSWGILGIFMLRLMLITRAVKGAIGVTNRALLEAFLGPTLLAASVGTAVFATDRFLGSMGAASALALDATVGVLTTIVGLLLVPRWFVASDLRWLISRSGILLPACVHTRLDPAEGAENG